MKMIEFLLWSNCPNNCLFCHQKKMHVEDTILDHSGMLESIKELSNNINNIEDKEFDILLVGGEILYPYYDDVSQELLKVIDKITDLINEKKCRFLYLNTNLLYKDRSLLKDFMDLVNKKGCLDNLKFTTSYDYYGRFCKDTEKLFLENFEWLLNNYYNSNSKLHPVANVIITKQLAEAVMSGEITYRTLQGKLRIPYINFIPYIPLPDDDSMTPTFSQIIKVLSHISKTYKNYILEYIKDFDFNQNKILYEYHKDKGYIECTAKYNTCGHNKNFSKVLNGECYICKLKEFFNIWN